MSDEEESICLKSYCPKFAFRCRYGACVSKNFRCSGGEPKCADGSDEDELLCGSRRNRKLIEANATGSIPSGSCLLPRRTDFRYVNNIFDEEYQPGAFVNNGEYIETTCTRGLAMNVSLNFDFSNTCNNTRWTRKWSTFPECQSEESLTFAFFRNHFRFQRFAAALISPAERSKRTASSTASLCRAINSTSSARSHTSSAALTTTCPRSRRTSRKPSRVFPPEAGTSWRCDVSRAAGESLRSRRLML